MNSEERIFFKQSRQNSKMQRPALSLIPFAIVARTPQKVIDANKNLVIGPDMTVYITPRNSDSLSWPAVQQQTESIAI